ncbi:thiamine pyrophosphate-dependent dehydrogenase E1 component subunit alpha [Candidatus Omnitrophota bacterium]
MKSKKEADLDSGIPMPRLTELYKKMLLIRRFEEKLCELFTKDLLFGTIHSCIGQEANAVGVIDALDKSKDIVISNHRGHGHYIALTNDVDGLMAEIMGRETGVVGGRGGSQHLHNRNFYSNGVQGGMVPIAGGMALAEKMKGTKAIVVCFIGDGTLGQGNVYESMNLASLFSVPIFYVLENNLYAMSTHVKDSIAGSIIDRAKAFGIDTAEITTNDVELIYKESIAIIKRIRSLSKSYFLCINTYRLCGHSKSDDCSYRTKEEEMEWRKKDPLLIAAAKLKSNDVKMIERECTERLKKSLQRGQNAPFPVLKNE